MRIAERRTLICANVQVGLGAERAFSGKSSVAIYAQLAL